MSFLNVLKQDYLIDINLLVLSSMKCPVVHVCITNRLLLQLILLTTTLTESQTDHVTLHRKVHCKEKSEYVSFCDCKVVLK